VATPPRGRCDGALTGCCWRGRIRASDAPCRARVSCGRSHRARGGGRRRRRAAACLRDAFPLWHICWCARRGATLQSEALQFPTRAHRTRSDQREVRGCEGRFCGYTDAKKHPNVRDVVTCDLIDYFQIPLHRTQIAFRPTRSCVRDRSCAVARSRQIAADARQIAADARQRLAA
jgi:hypothetical protein